jgi:hypothetical protein
MQRAICISSHPLAAEYGERALETGDSALEAVLSGFFAAAAAEPGVLFGPLALLAGGTGEAGRAYDGRARQPGLLGKRPRGYLPGQQPGPAASVAVPRGISALAVSTSYHGQVSLGGCCRSAITLARQQGATGRAELLSHVGGLGARALSETGVQRAWISQFGPVQAGQVTSADLRPQTGLDFLAADRGDELLLPWGTTPPRGAEAQANVPHALVAVDARGLFVGLQFTVLGSSVELAGYEVTVPLLAAPVWRGVPRVAPGTPLGGVPPLRLVREAGAVVRIEAELGPGRAPLSLYRQRETREVTRIA